MDLVEVIQKRFSCRSFLKEKPVPSDLLEKIIRLCQRAPSAGNLQAYRIVVISNSELKQKLAVAALDQNFLAQAPVVLVISAAPTKSEWKYQERGHNLYAIQDATIFASYCELVCTNFGLASIWVGAFSEIRVVNLLKDLVPAQYIEKPIALIAIGYCSEDPTRFTSRISTPEIFYSLE